MFQFGNIIIKEISIADAHILFKLIKNKKLEFYRPGIHNVCNTLEKLKERILLHQNIEPRLEIECFIYKKNSKEPIGIVSLQGIDYFNKTAELNFLMFIKPALKYGLEAIILSLYLAFNQLKLEKIYFYVAENNQIFLNLLKKRGFKEEAVLKKEIIFNNKRYNLHRFSIFPTDEYTNLWQKIIKLINFTEEKVCTIKL